MVKLFGQKEIQHGKGENKMNKIKSGMAFLVAMAFFAVLLGHAQSNKELQPEKVKQKAVTIQPKDKVKPVSIPERSAPKDFRQGYEMVADVLDGFGGESESDNYRIPVNSGGQPSAIGISESDNHVVKAGFVHASYVMHGDATGDGLIDVADILYLINYLFLGTSAPCPMEAGDATCDGIVDVADVLFLVNYLFLGTSPPGC
jgi:hypothetical protein